MPELRSLFFTVPMIRATHPKLFTPSSLIHTPMVLPWFDRLRVGQKIGLGYGIALSMALGGTAIALIASNYQKAGAWERVARSRYESELLMKLQSNVLTTRNQQHQILTHSREPEAILTLMNTVIAHEKKIAPTWVDIQTFSIRYPEFSKRYGHEARANFVKLNNRVVTLYFSELRAINQDLIRSKQAPGFGKLVDQKLTRFSKSKIAEDFDDLAQNLTDLNLLATQETLKAQSEIRAMDSLATQITLLSLLTSGLMAAAVGALISRAVGDSLKRVEGVAQEVIQSGDFSRRCAVLTQDEVGSLASSINQLITWVGSRTEALEQSHDRLEHNVQARTQELNAIIDHLGDGLLVSDAEGRIVRANPAFRHILGLDLPLTEMNPAHPIFQSAILNLIQTHHLDPVPLATEVLLPQGRIGQVMLTPILTGESAILAGSVMLVRDITTEKEVDQMKTDFLSTVSHELRTPLTSVLGFAKLIQKKMEEVLLPLIPMDDKKVQRTAKQVRENLHIIVSEGDRLTALINDVLDIAKIESGKVEWHMENLSLATIVDRAIAATSVLADNSGLTVKRIVPETLPEVSADRDRLIQVVINLLSNAIKFTDRGSVTCEVLSTSDEVEVRIQDTGIGLAESDLEKVFEKFKQVGEVMTDKPKGTGLGLPICKQIIVHHGGRIWVESVLGQGSTFIFALPIATPQIQPMPSDLQAIVKQLKESVDLASTIDATLGAIGPKLQKTILVVDDEPYIRQLLRQELEPQGYWVKEASDGMQALDIIRHRPPDLIVLDVMMPNMNGFDLAAILKNSPETMSIPIIILSIVEDQDRGYRLGVDRYQSKPINVDVLLGDIETLIAQGASNKRVMVVDGGITTINNLTKILMGRGYQIAETISGNEGVEQLMGSLQSHMVIIDSEVSNANPLVRTLRFDKDEESIYFILSDHPEREGYVVKQEVLPVVV